MQLINLNSKLISYWQLCFIFCAVSLIFFSPETSFAAVDDGISCTLQKVTKQLSGPIGKGVATIAVVVLGIGLFMGKLSWALALATAIGITLIFSADKVVGWLSGKNISDVACP